MNASSVSAKTGPRGGAAARRIASGLLVLALAAGSGAGCATSQLLREAKPHAEYDPKTHKEVEVPGRKSAYVGLPVTVAFDAVTAPVVFFFMIAWAAGNHGC